ncbi:MULTISPECIES: flagellar basal body P-ring formation chaperone FlgA [unclassified Roseivivax]|uniref:flagellar basal body P-ring formation chaperone FlgA n=1 Tax=Roseivivax sp. GX 12232 TaxID=2900547 RepID=UPI001E44449E|nr:flagellar basal body P-ring formation chaperone FlgA [Roseivivax sp. GX 12232]MCE0503894.1 flagellar basal body P-ring formation chaperone FlgA [Roseivivax sp. GX 12232]
MIPRALLTLAAAALTALPGALRAEAVAALVEEQARIHLGEALPAEAELTVTMTTAPIEEAMLLSAFWIDRKSGQFLANALTEGGEEVRLGGYAIATVPVAVPVRQILPGEILTEADLRVISLPRARVGSFALTDRDKLIGMEVRSLLTTGRAVMAQAVQEPLVIRRGQSVAIRLNDGRLVLSAPGRALRDAHAGEEIKVVNTVSNTTVTGYATKNGDVEILR